MVIMTSFYSDTQLALSPGSGILGKIPFRVIIAVCNGMSVLIDIDFWLMGSAEYVMFTATWAN